MIKSLRNERDLLQQQVTELQSVVDVQKSLLDKVNFEKLETKKEEKNKLQRINRIVRWLFLNHCFL
jgi:hypothetical protein